MRALMWLMTVVLMVLAVALAVLTLGAFASLGSTAPLWLRSVGSLEHAVSGQLGLSGITHFARAVGLAVLTSALAALAAYVKPRA
ncbi:hypothetical protein GCM10010840_01100 [Deinococcus aerolatus]|uniref:Uncharacterized protein n=2 Tax=Deinococcus aerolatus TaxID=522487 RepID=A0ABQ2FZ67_9DEIO|nr:hypothetical protein GCM10010840_01100 [Deinococcus aerolatus]